MAVYYIDGTFVDEGEAVLPVRDLIILRGYGVFDFLRTYNGRPFHLEEHLTRLRNSARLIGLHCPWSNDELASIVHQTLARNDFEESNIRLLVTGGDSEDGISPGPNPRLVVLIGDALRFPETCYRDGVKIITARLNRYIPGAKSIDYIRAIVTLKDAKAAGAVESIYVTEDDHVLEGTTSNLFIVKAGVVSTASEDILPGITRDVLLKILKPEFELQVRPVLRQELLDADEAFLASSNKEVMPVVAVDDQAIAGGRPGPVTRKVMSIFRDYTDRYGRKG
ncbi:MAG: aminotransferase class IV [Desulfofustis sp.]|nr:aminotransferase class IV [Desulfofustis sp.]